MDKTEEKATQDKDLEQYEIKQFGTMDQQTLEGMLAGYCVYDKTLETVDKRLTDPKNGDLLVESGIEGKMFDHKHIGKLFDDLLNYYKSYRRMMTLDDSAQLQLITGSSQDQSLVYSEMIADCHAAVVARHVSLRLLIERFKSHYYVQRADSIYQQFVRNRAQMDPKKAVEQFCTECRLELADPDNQPLVEYDLGEDSKKTISWVLDMKHNPEKYMGCRCGIEKVDTPTTGFKPGQLTVFVGRHGGYKTTLMTNVGYGLLMNGYNVLYASLEMEEDLLMAKILCRHSRKISWSKMYQGRISEPGDWALCDEAAARAIDESLSEEEREKWNKKHHKLRDIVSNVTRGEEEILLLNSARDSILSLPNKLKIARVGQSDKIKVGLLEKWIEERIEVWQPDVVIVDYLALVASDQAYSDRRDLEVGDVCKKFRAMGSRLGFHVITAAQYKRGAIERIREYGFANPEKAMLGTDDIAESNQIGADADTVFMLWPEDGGNRLRVFVPKARHAGTNVESFGVLQVDQDHCTISDDITDTKQVSNNIGLGTALSLAQAIGEGNPLAPKIPDGEDVLDSPFSVSQEEPMEKTEEELF
jgi:replicative DNA helicase